MAVGVVLLVFMSRGEGDGEDPPGQAKTAAEQPPVEPEPKETKVPQVTLPKSTCPADLTNCVVASGRVIYVEKVDPDGDGDAHFVTASSDSVTATGLTIFDVRSDLRPDPLPGVGDLVGGAGPVFPGSRGQKQIEVIEFHVAPDWRR